jgi:protein-disulfide isomerase
MRGWVLALVALAGAGLGAGGMALADRARGGPIGPEVRAYLLAHPEVLTEAMGRLQDRESGRLVAQHRDAIVKPYPGAWAGNPRGDVTVVQYYDYNCGYCRASVPAVDKLLARDAKVRIVYRELPILHETSRAAARASLAAAAQGRFVAFHRALYAAGPVSTASIAAAGRRAGVDPARIPADADAELRRNLEVASALNFSGTPSWVIGDRILAGLQPVEALEEAVAAARKR